MQSIWPSEVHFGGVQIHFASLMTEEWVQCQVHGSEMVRPSLLIMGMLWA